MPPTFAYAMALLAYLALACIVWALALVLAVPRETRPVALRLAAGMAGSFPGVFLFQLLAAPIVALGLLSGWVIMSVTGGGGWIDVALFGLALSALAIFTLASLAGFYAGWRVGWEVAAGRPTGALLLGYGILGVVLRAIGRWVRAVRT